MALPRLVQLTLEEMKTLMGVEEHPPEDAAMSRFLFQPVRQDVAAFFSRLESGGLAGAFYGSPGELRSMLRAFLQSRTARGDSRLVLLASDRLREAVAAIRKQDPDLTDGLKVIDWDDKGAQTGSSGPEPRGIRRFIERLHAEIGPSGPAGSPRVCLIREPVHPEAKADVRAYLRQQDEFESSARSGQGLIVLDLFARSLSPAMLKAAIITHRQLVLGGRPYPNSRYTPAATYADRTTGSTDVGRLMAGIEHDHQERLRKDFLECILTGTDQPFAAYGPDGRMVACNRAFCALTGYDVDEIGLLGLEADLVPEDVRAQALAVREKLLGQGLPQRTLLVLIDKSGNRVPVRAVSNVKPSPGGKPELIYSFFNDLRDELRDGHQEVGNDPHPTSEEPAETMHCGLTGLPSRSLFLDRLSMSLARARRHDDYRLAVLAIGFDRPGGSGGPLDRPEEGGPHGLLRSTAQRIGKSLRSMDTATHMGGLRFSVILEDLGDEIDGVRVARRVQTELCTPFRLRGRELSLSCSVGMAYASQEQDVPDSLMRAAETALDRAFGMGVRRIEISDILRHDQAIRFLRLESEIERALSSHELSLRYQPILSLDDRRIRGFEVFIRWDHPELGLLSPDEFMPLVEPMDCADVVETWVLREACRQLKVWQALPGGEELFVSVNISGKNLLRPDFLGRIEDVLGETDLSPADIRLEARESVIAEHPEMAGPCLEALAARGIGLYLDDFGRGSSSVVLLHSLPIAGLKVPAACLGDPGLAGNIAVLADQLRINVIWKGIETPAELAGLADLGSRSGQGKLFSPPLAGKIAESLIGRPLAGA